MFKYIAFVAMIAVVAGKPGLLATHSVVDTAHVGSVVHSVPSAVSSQHFTRIHNSAVVSPVLAPVVKSYVAAPVVHAEPLVHAAPVVHSVHAAPIVHSVHAAPVVHSVHAAPLVHSVHAAPALHVSPVVHSVHAAPLIKSVVSPAYGLSLHH